MRLKRLKKGIFKNKMSAYQAKILRTNTILYSSTSHDRENEHHGWFSCNDGNSRDCMFVMDNRQLNRMILTGEAEILNI